MAIDIQTAPLRMEAVSYLIADPDEIQLLAMFRGIDPRAQKTTMAMMAVAYKLHPKVLA